MKKNRLSFYALLLSALLGPGCQSEGARIYAQACNNCHMEKGTGFAKLIPPFDTQAFRLQRRQIICTVISGVNDSITGSYMPVYNRLSDIQISNVLNYIQHLTAMDNKAFTDQEVAESRKDCR